MLLQSELLVNSPAAKAKAIAMRDGNGDDDR